MTAADRALCCTCRLEYRIDLTKQVDVNVMEPAVICADCITLIGQFAVVNSYPLESKQEVTDQ